MGQPGPESLEPGRRFTNNKNLLWAGGLLASVALIAWMMLGGGSGAPPVSLLPEHEDEQAADGLADGEQARFAAELLRESQQIWEPLLRHESEVIWEQPALVLFTERTTGACGYSQTTAGSFYCPANQTLFLDLASFSLLERDADSSDFTRSYVLAHALGHHVQNLMESHKKRTGAQPAEPEQAQAQARAQALTPEQRRRAHELQADCYAGVWFNHNYPRRKELTRAQLQQGLQATAILGQEAQEASEGQDVLVPDSLTHGDTESRVGWFRRGLTSGKISACDMDKQQTLGRL
jgi:predicted metalloprotease